MIHYLKCYESIVQSVLRNDLNAITLQGFSRLFLSFSSFLVCFATKMPPKQYTEFVIIPGLRFVYPELQTFDPLLRVSQNYKFQFTDYE